jgi:hypothetical protein
MIKTTPYKLTRTGTDNYIFYETSEGAKMPNKRKQTEKNVKLAKQEGKGKGNPVTGPGGPIG